MWNIFKTKEDPYLEIKEYLTEQIKIKFKIPDFVIETYYDVFNHSINAYIFIDKRYMYKYKLSGNKETDMSIYKNKIRKDLKFYINKKNKMTNDSFLQFKIMKEMNWYSSKTYTEWLIEKIDQTNSVILTDSEYQLSKDNELKELELKLEKQLNK